LKIRARLPRLVRRLTGPVALTYVLTYCNPSLCTQHRQCKMGPLRTRVRSSVPFPRALTTYGERYMCLPSPRPLELARCAGWMQLLQTTRLPHNLWSGNHSPFTELRKAKVSKLDNKLVRIVLQIKLSIGMLFVLAKMNLIPFPLRVSGR